MRIVFFGKGARGATCLKRLVEGTHSIALVVGHPLNANVRQDDVGLVAERAGLSLVRPGNPNDEDVLNLLRKQDADVFVLGGYGYIVQRPLLQIPKKTCINLHGGKLPEYRGSSPLNWSLINGESEFGLSIIEVDEGVDTGPVLASITIPIDMRDSIADLHEEANAHFPEMLETVLGQLERNAVCPRIQDLSKAAYYPVRFPEDGVVLWDMYTAEEVHNRIRALTSPYPCAFSYCNGRKVLLIKSDLCNMPYFGEPGRIYRVEGERILVCAKDCCLWVTEAYFSDTGETIMGGAVSRYTTMGTIYGAAAHVYETMKVMS